MKAIYRKLVSTYDVDLLFPSDCKIYYRIEILKLDSLYSARLLRYEWYRLKPSFPENKDTPDDEMTCDEKMLIIDTTNGRILDGVIATSEDECIRLANEAIFAFFNRS